MANDKQFNWSGGPGGFWVQCRFAAARLVLSPFAKPHINSTSNENNCLMHLSAMHHDGFTEHLVSWELEAAHGTAIVEASWHHGGGRTEREFELEFPDSRIKQCADVLAELKPVYNGHCDDLPIYSLSVTEGDRELTTKVLVGFNWPDEDKAAVDAFMRVWRPLSADVEKLLAIPGRSRYRK